MSEGDSIKPKPKFSWLKKFKGLWQTEMNNQEDVLSFLRCAKQEHILDPDAFAMIEGVLEVSKMRARDVMVPRAQMVVVEQDMPLEKIMPIVVESAHSRFPVIGENRDEAIGILLAKDLLRFTFGDFSHKFNVQDIVRPVIFVPESKRLNILLREFRHTHNHMALIVDEYGGLGGLITIEDVLEQIVGEIEDEHDLGDDPYIKRYSDSKYIVKALTPIEDFNKFFSENFSDEEYDTIGGLVMAECGYLPKRGEVIVVKKYQFKVLHADKRRIRVLQVKVMHEKKS